MLNKDIYLYQHFKTKTMTVTKSSNLLSINWKDAKELVLSGKLNAIGSNLGQINNQGEFYINPEKTHLYKRRNSANRCIIDLIAKS